MDGWLGEGEREGRRKEGRKKEGGRKEGRKRLEEGEREEGRGKFIHLGSQRVQRKEMAF